VTIQIRPATADDIPAIRAFNERLDKGHAGFQFPETPRALGVPRDDGAPVWHELFVASDGSHIRAGFAIKRELLSTQPSGESLEIGNYQIPLSEGIVDKRFATLGIRLLQEAMARQNRLYCLGMGSVTRPLPRLLQRFSWTVEEVPFRFLILRAAGFLSNIEFLRGNKKPRLLLDLARWTGAGALGVRAWRGLSALRAPAFPRGFTSLDIKAFDTEADELYRRVSPMYGAIIDRTAAALNVRFPALDERLTRILARRGGDCIGWVVVSLSQCRSHKQFGNMRLGCIVDGLCDPKYAGLMVRLATEKIRRQGADLIVSNQTHRAWLAALRRNGFIGGPSNFIFARSPELANKTPALGGCHINRGDGDGPINL
jgi:hypothetical protein